MLNWSSSLHHVWAWISLTILTTLCLSADALATPQNNGNKRSIVGSSSSGWEIKRWVGGLSKRQSSSSTGIDSNGFPGPAPSTSVALIILYSVTGIITALFLLIIVTGAVRAHRHPERYGPRAIARFGRPRQSRAKGLARAVLDTIPIVRFGASPEPAVVVVKKPADVEMQDRGTTPDPETEMVVKEIPGATVPPATDAGDHSGSEEQTTTTPAATTTEGLSSQNQCPVCMEDFEQGQEVRVLPCQHNFHPDCIDPWLLNVSGSCPLCRIDLHPEEEPEDETTTTEVPQPPPPVPHHGGSRLSRYLDIARGSSGEERMAALRQLREEGRTSRRRSRIQSLRLGRRGHSDT
ncbi:hypothetical protein K440DRAFT_662194 [Wilcoxina mikolae CBS 423.85]|nr:hypothetical protein K440DRAFT_662194 [Wilcoxina mikolae CBS 423.85]